MIFLFTAVSPILSAQQLVSGRITDAADGTPVAGASVFIANTTIGAASDLGGNYSFTVPGRGSFEIVVSHVSYQAVFSKIDEPKDSHRYDVALETTELEEVTVKAAKTYKNADITLFWQKVLGEKPSKRGLEVLNPEKIYFYKSTNILKAFCREPIEIINHQAGYSIRYILQRFEHDYQTGVTELEGLPSFEELVPLNSREEEQWAKKRQEVYSGSINRFLRAIYREQVNEEGFLLVNKELLMYGITSIVPEKEILRNEQGETTLNISESLYLLNFPNPLTDQTLQYINLPDLLNIKVSKPEATNSRMDELLQYKDAWTSPNANRVRTMQVSQQNEYESERNSKKNIPIVVELLPSQITVYPDGTYTGLLTLGEVNKYMGGLLSKVPVEYPETLQNSADTHTHLRTYALEQAEENIAAQLEAFPQEKIHLHTDRDMYIPGEKIWFKAYVADANTHVNTTNSYYAYVELISPDDTLVGRVMVTQIDGMFFGRLPIAKNIPEGDYTLRAYTRYMENMGDDYFFKKNIRISPSPSLPNREGERGAAGHNAEQKHHTPLLGELEEASFDVSFFPEGGNLPEGVLCKVAFKALNRNGYPEAVTGSLIDESGNEINDVRTYHAGMGVFTYLPVTGKKYFLKCRNENGREKLFELPQPNPLTYSLAASMQTDRIMIGVQKSGRSPNIPCYLLVHCRGEVLYFSEWDSKQTVSLPTDDIPVGVIQILLLDGQMNPLSERLVFSSNSASGTVDFLTDKDTYQVRDKIVATLSFPDSLSPSLLERAGEGLLSPSLLGRVGEGFAHFSIAVTDDKDIVIDESTTILSSLLLSSELKGYIENPAYYLQDPVAMDLLMMTHGWRRYNMPEVAKGHLEHPKISVQEFQGISGRVETVALSRPVRDSEIIIMMQNAEDKGFRSTTTDEKGLFAVQDLDFPDSTTVFIQALSRNGRNDLIKLSIDNEVFPVPVYAPQSPQSKSMITNAETKDDSLENTFIEKAEQHAKFDENVWTLYLDEVEVTAPKIVKKDESRLQYWANSSSDNTITKEIIEEYKYPSIVSYLRMLPGINVIEDSGESGLLSIYFTSTTPIFLGETLTALILIDGVQVDGNILANLRGNEIESIDAFSGIGATVFGVRGAGGVISVTTKQGSTSNIQGKKPNNSIFIPLGYQKPVEFYAPKYETPEARQSLITDYRSTIFWKPDIVMSDDDKVSFEFYAADFPTMYSVVIEGITNDGKIIRQVEKIQVR